MPRPRRGTQLDLVVGAPPVRLAGLRRVQKQLLARIARKKKDIAGFVEQARAIETAIAGDLAPVVAACRKLNDEIVALFDELLAPGRLSRRAQKQVARLYGMLEEDGVIAPPLRASRAASDEGDGEDEDDFDFDEPDDDARPPRHAGGVTASRPDAGKGPIATIRAVYRRLAHALHPDKVVDEGERARRTEIMKDVTRAYGDGDLARLLDLERAWAAAGEPTEAADDVALRCAAIERTNAELRAQLRGLDRELADLRGSPHGDLVRHRRAGGNPISELAADAQDQRATLEGIRDHVIAFRDGKLALADFLRGPGFEDEAAFMREAEAALVELASALDPPRRRRGARRR